MAKALERKEEDFSRFMGAIDMPTLEIARVKMNVLLQEQGRDKAKSSSSKGHGKSGGKKGKDRPKERSRSPRRSGGGKGTKGKAHQGGKNRDDRRGPVASDRAGR